MPWTDLLLLLLVVRGYFAFGGDIARVWRAFRAPDDGLTSVVDFEEQQQALRSQTFPRSIP